MSDISLKKGRFIIPLWYKTKIQTARPIMNMITIIAEITPEFDGPVSTMMVSVWSV